MGETRKKILACTKSNISKGYNIEIYLGDVTRCVTNGSNNCQRDKRISTCISEEGRLMDNIIKITFLRTKG